MITDRWKHGAIPALMIHGCIGTVYCWSLLTDEIKDKIGAGYEWAFSLAILFLGLSAAFLGPFVERDVRRASQFSALFFGVGMVLSGLACYIGSKPLLFVGYGVIMGIGLGLGYLSPVKTLMLWFSDNKGLATGLAISGFGLAKVVATPSFKFVMGEYGIVAMFIVHGAIYTFIMILGSLLLKKPEGTETNKSQPFSFELWLDRFSNALKVKGLWLYWVIFFLNITAGLAIISHEKVLFNASGYGEYIAIALVMCAVFNTLGRLCVAWASDYLKYRWMIFMVVLALSAVSCYASLINIAIFVPCAVLLCNGGYGAVFSTMPSALADRYGMSSVSEIHGVILSAWAVAGLCGNQMASYIMRITDGDTQMVLYGAGVLYIVGFLLTLLFIRQREA